MVPGQEGFKVHLSAKATSKLTRVEDRETERRLLGNWPGATEGTMTWNSGDVGSRPSSGSNTLGGWVRLCPSLEVIP